MFNKFKTSSIFLLISAFALGIALSFSDYYDYPDKGPDINGLLWPNPKPLRQFGIMDHRGDFFTLNNLQGQWSFLFFGYTHCPDVCPLTMSLMKQFSQRLSDEHSDLKHQVIFVTVDPERDTQNVLKEYIEYFNPEFIGLGGTNAQVFGLTREIGVAFFLQEKDDDGNYLVDHSASIFMIDPQGRLSGILSAPHELAATYQNAIDIIDYTSKQK